MTTAPSGALADAMTRVTGEEHYEATNAKGLRVVLSKRLNNSGITPLDLKVLVRPDPAEEVSKGGIIIPDSTKDRQKFAVTKATIVAVGANAFRDWGEVFSPAPGERILHAQYAGARVKGEDGEDYIIMNDEDVVAWVEEAKK